MMSRGKQYDDIYNGALMYSDGTNMPYALFNGRYIKEPAGPVDESVLSFNEVDSWKNSSDEVKRNIYTYMKEFNVSDHYITSLSQTQLDDMYNFIHTRNDVPKYYIMKSIGFDSITGEDKKSNDPKIKQKIEETRNQIKNHIMKNGSLRTAVFGTTNNQHMQDVNTTTSPMITFYRSTAPSLTEDSHAVSLVGWDDNFSKDNFVGISEKPKHDGAYLAVNSWGESWGPQHGYLWISYDDYTIEENVDGVTEIRNKKANVDEMVVDIVNQAEYTGKEIKPQITCKFGNDGEKLEEHLDYEIIDTVTDNINAGKKSLTLKGIGRFQGEREIAYEIKPRALTVTADSKTKKSGKTDPELTYKISRTIDGQTPKFTGKLQRQSGEAEGTYEITQGTLALEDDMSSGFKASNYTIKFVPGKFTIGQNAGTGTENVGYEFVEYNGKQYLKNIYDKTSSLELKNSISTNGTMKIYKNNSEISMDTSTIIETGMIIKIELGSAQKEYIAVVKGDTNCDGKCSIQDMLLINKHRLNKLSLNGEKLLAGDVNGDSVANFRDMLLINKYRLGKIFEL